MSNRLWIPSDYYEEWIPAPRPCPSDWIIKLDDGRFALVPADEDIVEPDLKILAEGETVLFDWTVRIGVFDIKFDDAGAWTSSAEIPRTFSEGTLLFWFPGDPDSVTEDLDDLLTNEFKSDPEMYPAEEVTIGCYAWGNRAHKFTFTAGQFVEAPDAT